MHVHAAQASTGAVAGQVELRLPANIGDEIVLVVEGTRPVESPLASVADTVESYGARMTSQRGERLTSLIIRVPSGDHREINDFVWGVDLRARRARAESTVWLDLRVDVRHDSVE